MVTLKPTGISPSRVCLTCPTLDHSPERQPFPFHLPKFLSRAPTYHFVSKSLIALRICFASECHTTHPQLAILKVGDKQICSGVSEVLSLQRQKLASETRLSI